MKYRPEIDGLRAIAVLLVLIFHIDKELLPGGFIGVDVFFVISGFLITSIIQKSLQSESFSYKSFYVNRIKRLLPLFFAVVLFSILAGYFILLPVDFEVFGSDVLAANLFLANLKSALSFNYFESKQLLLHFWSLAVEEQFYFIMPTALLLIHKYVKKFLIHILIFFFLGSLVLAEFASSVPDYAQWSYFLLPTRAWELLGGCMLAVMKINVHRKIGSALSILGIFMIILSVFIIDEMSVFPGLIALIPVLGAMFLIVGGENGFGYVLKAKPLVVIGLMSYSIYMWHWPIIIVIRTIFKINDFTLLQLAFLSIFIVGIGYLSQKYIEDFFRYMKNINLKKAVLYYFLIPFAITSAFSFYVYSNNGMPERYNVDEIYTKTSTTKCSHIDIGCYITALEDKSNNVLMIGDSHADHFSNLFSKWFDDEKLSLRLFAAGGCNFYSQSFYNTSCEVVKSKLKTVLQNVNTVIIAKRFDGVYKDEIFLKEFKDYVSQLTESGISVIIVKQVPKFRDSNFLNDWLVSRRYGSSFDYNNNVMEDSYISANETVLNLFADNKDMYVLDLNNTLLVGDVYKKFDENNMPLYYNSNHLTAYASDWIYARIKASDNYNWVVDLIKNEKVNEIRLSNVN